MALRAAGEPGEEALLRWHVAELGDQLPETRDAAERAVRDQSAIGQGDQRGHQRQRDEQGDDDHAHPGRADGTQDAGPEQQQAGEADRDRDPGEQHRAARRRHRRDQRVLARLPGRPRAARVQAAVQFLAIARHDEEPVVDAQSQAEHRDHVDHRRVEVDRVRERQQRSQRTADRRDGADDREAGGEEPAEDQDHHQQADGQRDQLARQQVLLDLAGDRVEHDGAAADERRGSGHGRGDLGAERGQFLLHGVEQGVLRRARRGRAPG